MITQSEVQEGLNRSDTSLCLSEIKQIIPYDHPFLFVTRVRSLEDMEIEADYWADPLADYFRGHFVGCPIMPGVLIGEGLGQTGSLLVRSHLVFQQDKDVLAYRVEDLRFYSPVLPGSTLIYRVRLLSIKRCIAQLEGKALVNDTVVARGRFVQAIVERNNLISTTAESRQ